MIAGAIVIETGPRWAGYAPIVLSIAPAVWVAVTWDAEPPLAVPVLASALPLLARTPLYRIALRWIALILLALFDVYAMSGVGVLFGPATIAMLFLALWPVVGPWKQP